MMRRSAAAGAALLCAWTSFSAEAFAADAASTAQGERIVLEFVGSFARLPVMRAEVVAQVDAERYAGEVMFRSAGLAGFFKTARIQGAGEGARIGDGFAPETYEHVEVNGRKRREVVFDYQPDDVVVTATPPFGSPGDPAPTAEQRREALDPLAMILSLTMSAGEDPCSRTLPVFDSKLRYDLVLEPDGFDDDLRTPGYRGPAIRCRAYYRPIAGYDPEDLAEPEVYATPIQIWLAEVSPGVLAPARLYVRFASAILPFSVKLELKSASVGEAGAGAG